MNLPESVVDLMEDPGANAVDFVVKRGIWKGLSWTAEKGCQYRKEIIHCGVGLAVTVALTDAPDPESMPFVPPSPTPAVHATTSGTGSIAVLSSTTELVAPQVLKS